MSGEPEQPRDPLGEAYDRLLDLLGRYYAMMDEDDRLQRQITELGVNASVRDVNVLYERSVALVESGADLLHGEIRTVFDSLRGGRPASIRDQLPPDRRAAWDRLWERLLVPRPEDDTEPHKD